MTSSHLTREEQVQPQHHGVSYCQVPGRVISSVAFESNVQTSRVHIPLANPLKGRDEGGKRRKKVEEL